MPARLDSHPVFLTLRIILGIFFLFVGGDKLIRLDEFVETVANYEIVTAPWDQFAAYLVVWMEIVIGLCLMLCLLYKGALVSLACMVVVFIVSLSQAWVRGLEISCGCTPWASKESTNYGLAIAQNLAIFIIVCVLYWARKTMKHRFRGKRLVLPD